MSEGSPTAGLATLRRASGAYAMLAIDQREALRAMMAERRGGPVEDAEVTAFKLAAAQTLTPYASGVLLDKQFVLDRAIADHVIASTCALIAGADEFIATEDELVGKVRIDSAVEPRYYAQQGAVAMKLLVLWRPDEAAAERIDMVRRFVGRCHDAGLAAIIEPVSRAPRDGRAWEWNDGVLAAAAELGSLGADLYKAEVPRHGLGEPGLVQADCARITHLVDGPWVVLSSGVDPDAFPDAVALAIEAGASGFLAGRAVWKTSLAAEDVEASLRTDAVARLQRLCQVADTALAAAGRGA